MQHVLFNLLIFLIYLQNKAQFIRMTMTMAGSPPSIFIRSILKGEE